MAGIIAGGLLLLLMAGPARALKAETVSASQFLSTVNVPGVSSDVNNIAFAFNGEYSVVAPFETSDPAHQDPFFGDNHYLVITSLKNPSNPIRLDLTSIGQAATTCYYPTHLIVSSNNIAFVRATAADPATHQPLHEVIAYGQLALDKGASEVRFESFVPIKINELLPTADPGSVPIGFGVSKAGGFLVFTNGAQVFSVNLTTGDTYTIQPVPGERYSPVPDPGDLNASTSDFETITSLDVDTTNVVSVVVNGRSGGSDFSRILFYGLREGVKHAGTFDSLALPVESARFGEGQIAPGSETAVSPDRLRGYFATTDGCLWGLDLKSSPSLNLIKLGNYSSMAGVPGYLAGPRNVGIDPSGKSLSIVKQGGTMNIRRPAYGRHGGGIRRPAYSRYDEAPGLVLVYLNGDGSVARDLEVHPNGFSNGAYAVSCPAFTQDGGAYIAVSSFSSPGALKVLDKSGSLNDVGSAIPNNIDRITSPDGLTLVGIKDFDVNADVPSPETGGVVFMSLQQGASDLAVASRTVAIRRPCNANH